MTVLDRFFESYYRLRPVNATFTGVHDHDDRLPDWSPEGLEAAVAEMRTLRAALAGELAGAALHDAGSRDLALALSFLDVQIAETESRHFQQANPSLAVGEAVFGVIALMTRPFAPVDARAASAAARLRATDGFLDGARRSLVAPIPAPWRAKALRELEGAERLFRDGIACWIRSEAIADETAESLTSAATHALGGVQRFRTWLERVAPVAAASAAASGGELFDLFLARGHWCDVPRAELNAAAAAAFEEALARLDERARPAGGWAQVQNRLAEDHPSTDGYLAAFQRKWEACREFAVAHRLVTWPDYPIRYVPIPRCARDAAPNLYYLFYRSPAPFDPPAVHDYVVTPVDDDLDAAERERRLRANNHSVITLNHVVHHGAIGHHVQNYAAYHGVSAIGKVAAVDCASRIGMFLGGTMAEGWACYATDLMDEAGFLTSDESLAQQHTRARLLARAIVDIRLHEGSIDFDGAASLYRDRIGMSPDAAAAETCKNSMFPGAAVMYWLGADTIHRLRRAHGRSSDALRQFHDRLLAFGSIPVPLIERIWQ
jgi:hypothetical protein